MTERLIYHPLTIAELCQIRQEPWAKVVRWIVPFKSQLIIPISTEQIKNISIPKEVYSQFDFLLETDVPAEDWLTTTAMAFEIGVEYEWVNRRLLFLSTPGEFRIGSAGPKLHMHPDALEELEEIRKQSIIEIDPELYINLDQLAEELGRHPLWVSNRIQFLEISAVLGLDKVGKSVVYYQRKIVETLKEKRDQYPEAEDMLTIPMIAKEAGKDREWVESEIQELSLVPQLRRFPHSGRVDMCFKSSEAKLIIESAKKYTSPPQGWKTKNAILALTGKSENWLSKRLQQYQSRSQFFTDSQGVQRRHFSPQVVEQLVKEASGEYETDEIAVTLKNMSEGNIIKLRKILTIRNETISLESLLLRGISENDINEWMKYGLITKWSSGQYYFTNKARQLLTRLTEAELETERIKKGMQSLQALYDYMSEYDD